MQEWTDEPQPSTLSPHTIQLINESTTNPINQTNAGTDSLAQFLIEWTHAGIMRLHSATNEGGTCALEPESNLNSTRVELELNPNRQPAICSQPIRTHET